ncbi:hypothetical protein EYR38_001423 [Pleurotus pulmonarius]|nr:hypothetical protein EYR38_001423 [Pleurotus pulmonarius]
MSESHIITHPSWEDETGDYHNLWLKWWGSSEDEAEIGVGKVVHFFVPLRFSRPTAGQFLVRQHHSKLFEDLLQLTTDRYGPGGVVICGQPGSGKTYSLLFLLLKMLSKRMPVLFVPFVLDEGCFRDFDSQTSWTCALVNTDIGIEPPHRTLLAANNIFIVQATSPRISRYKDWAKQDNASIWYMERWTKEEIVRALSLVPGLSEKVAPGLESSVSNASEKWGWAPRDIYTAITNEQNLEIALTTALLGLDTLRQLLKLLTEAITGSADNSESESHDIISLYQCPTGGPLMDFKSPYIRYRVQERIGIVHPEEARTFIHLLRYHRESAPLYGWAFENLVFSILCGPMNQGDLSPPCLASVSPDGTKWSLQIDPSDPGQAPTSRPPHPVGRTRVTFDNLGNVTLDDTKLFVPPQPNFPFLDAFFLQFDRQESHVVVVVLQVTTSLKHHGSAKGYAFLERLRTHLEHLGGRENPARAGKRSKEVQVSFTYRLMVPSPSQSQTFTWIFPGKLPRTISGDVYIQAAQLGDPILIDEEDESSFAEDA